MDIPFNILKIAKTVLADVREALFYLVREAIHFLSAHEYKSVDWKKVEFNFYHEISVDGIRYLDNTYKYFQKNVNKKLSFENNIINEW